MMNVETETVFYDLGMRLINRHPTYRSESGDRAFRSFFGVSPSIVVRCWDLLKPTILDLRGVQPVHLLWACMFLKVYGPECTLSAIAKASEKTYRKWVWNIIYAFSNLEPIVVSENEYK